MSRRRKPQHHDPRRVVHREIQVHPDADSALAAALGYQCPDCTSEVALIAHAPGVTHIQVRHDSTCPWLAARADDR